MQIERILHYYGLNAKSFVVENIASGYINNTYKLKGDKSFILQRINSNVFKNPEIVASNLRSASNFLKTNHPDYFFLSAIQTTECKEMVYDTAGFPWRLFPYIENSLTLNKVEAAEEAFSAATEFGKLTSYLVGVDLDKFQPTIDRFHDLNWRYQQFEDALKIATPGRLQKANDTIELCISYNYLVGQYDELVTKGFLQRRIMHNDSKLNNILFDASSRKAICVIDLDTLMPGYFIYDIGDMIRTFVTPVNEEERDLNKIVFRKNIYDALVEGYLSEMQGHLNETEKKLFPFAGLMMTYIMALRMLTDFLQGDTYYQITYPGQNLTRAKNQIRLLEILKNELVG